MLWRTGTLAGVYRVKRPLRPLPKLARALATLSVIALATACGASPEDAAGSLRRGAAVKLAPKADGDGERESNPKLNNPVVQKGFNPQPEPPANPDDQGAGFINNQVVEKGLNPQPEPPGVVENPDDQGAGFINDAVVEKGFNPQPEPPGRPVATAPAKRVNPPTAQ